MEMVQILKQAEQNFFNENNIFSTKAKLDHVDSLLGLAGTPADKRIMYQLQKADLLIEYGDEEEAINLLEAIEHEKVFFHGRVLKSLALAYLRLGERTNCIESHAAESCILPLSGVGIHRDSTGSLRAISIYEKILAGNPDDLESRWLLNIAYMTINKYPEGMPQQYLLPGMEGNTQENIKPFVEVAADLGLDVNTMAGGLIVDDFDSDGLLDLIMSVIYVGAPLQYFRNNGDGTFADLSVQAGLDGITGGLNIMQTDFNNDGHKDFFVLRGGWQKDFGNQPNSLIRNNGDGTFTDITTISGLLSFHPTQTATWNDFNNDGFLDVFIGNESGDGLSHRCELFINQGDETFRETGRASKCAIGAYVKGVTSGDYDNDGWIDLFISTMSGKRVLFRNKGLQNGEVRFEDVSVAAGISRHKGNTFPTWFWDYDNDGWLDIFVCDYSFRKSLGVYAASEKLAIDSGASDKLLLYHNNQDGTFTNVAKENGLATHVFAMGSNFGDVDNDGFLDMYLGTGNPGFQSLIPNRMFLNKQGKMFADVTASARVGHLQKGHGVAFADFDNDGDQDIYIEMGGAYLGDAYQNALFLNPKQNDNNWITLELVGTSANRSAIGSRLTLYVSEDGVKRKIVRDVNSGGSFGSSPLRREIGTGKATKVDKIEIQWRGSNGVQTVENISCNNFYRITQNRDEIEKLAPKKIVWSLPNLLCDPKLLN
jgi:hypothetical protein